MTEHSLRRFIQHLLLLLGIMGLLVLLLWRRLDAAQIFIVSSVAEGDGVGFKKNSPGPVNVQLKDKVIPVRPSIPDQVKGRVQALAPSHRSANRLQALQRLVIDRLIPQRTILCIPVEFVRKDATDEHDQLVERARRMDPDAVFSVEVLSFAAAETRGPDAMTDVDIGADGAG